jgi:hypothetical protein
VVKRRHISAQNILVMGTAGSKLGDKNRNSKPKKHKVMPCPTCGAKQKINLALEGIFPYQTCQSCHHPFYVNKDLTVRKLSEEEKRELPGAWIQVAEDMNKNKVALVFGLE